MRTSRLAASRRPASARLTPNVVVVKRQQQIEQRIAGLGEGQRQRGVPRIAVRKVRLPRRLGWLPPLTGSCPALFRILAETARQQLAAAFEHRVGRRRQMRVDALQVAHDVEVQPGGLDAFRSCIPAQEVRLGGAGFELAEDLLFADQLPGRAAGPPS